MPYKDRTLRMKAGREASLRWKQREPERARLCHTWTQLRQRCSNPRHPRYKDYGGRGISVCQRWDSFDAFVSDMGPRPTPAHTIDRIDNNGPYSPENCRWATRLQQSENKRNCRYVEVGREKVTLKEACFRLGLSYKMVHLRITRFGFSVERALSAPRRPGGRARRNPA